MSKKDKTMLVALCEKSVLDASFKVVVPEPYIPHIPEPWNGVLVLAEAQNLGNRIAQYVGDLKSLTREERFRRLGHWAGFVGVKPWDDGTLKLAVEAALDVDAAETAVSNAVLWSTVTKGGTNENPQLEVVSKAADLWTEMLAVMKPERIVTAGAVARDVAKDALRRASCKAQHIVWALPSPRVLAPLSAMVSEDALRNRFPEVDNLLAKDRGWGLDAPRRGKVLYACLAVMASRQPRP